MEKFVTVRYGIIFPDKKTNKEKFINVNRNKLNKLIAIIEKVIACDETCILPKNLAIKCNKFCDEHSGIENSKHCIESIRQYLET